MQATQQCSYMPEEIDVKTAQGAPARGLHAPAAAVCFSPDKSQSRRSMQATRTKCSYMSEDVNANNAQTFNTTTMASQSAKKRLELCQDGAHSLIHLQC